MTKFKFIIVFYLSLIFFSCEKNPDQLTITMNNTGTITFYVVDGTIPIEGARVRLYSGFPPVMEGETDASGIFTTDKVLEGTYTYTVEASKDGNLINYDDGMIQVISGNSKSVKSQPYANMGTFTLTVLNDWRADYAPVKNINVSLTKNIYHSDRDAVDNALFMTKTDNNGIVKFVNLPDSQYYTYWIYSVDTNGNVIVYGSTSFFVRKKGNTFNTQQISYSVVN